MTSQAAKIDTPIGPSVDGSIDTSIDTWTYFEDRWQPGNISIMGPRTHAAWLGSTVFDGARFFNGAAPDLDLHCARVNASATSFLLDPVVPEETWIALAWDGIGRFEPDAELYIRPMYWAEDGAAGGGVRFDPGSTRWCLCIYRAPMPAPQGFAITLSPFRRPTLDCAPVEAKAGCLYPNGARALIEAHKRGFGNCVMNDALGNVAELANSNIFMAKNGVVYTPVPNGTFLAGVTRRRVIALLEGAGVTVREQTLHYRDFETADEISRRGTSPRSSRSPGSTRAIWPGARSTTRRASSIGTMHAASRRASRRLDAHSIEWLHRCHPGAPEASPGPRSQISAPESGSRFASPGMTEPAAPNYATQNAL